MTDQAAQDAAERLLDKIEDRVRDAPPGLHQPGDRAALASDALSAEAALLWAHYDGFELGHAETVLLPLAAHQQATEAAVDIGVVRTGDRVVGEQGRDLLVVPSDPWEEGAGLIAVEEDAERVPLASTPIHFVLAMLGVYRVLYDEEGEFREGLVGEDGELSPEAERQICRRILDEDKDAPQARFRLAQLLRRAGELRAARSELRFVVQRAPQFAWAQFELGRVEKALEHPVPAGKAFHRAAETASDDGLRALCLAHAASVTDASQRQSLADRVRELYPSFAKAQEAGAREGLANGDVTRAQEQVSVGLAVEPGHLGLLSLRSQFFRSSE